MNWPTVLCVSIASACLTLAAMHFVIWAKHRAHTANLAFVVLAIGVAAFSWTELGMMLAESPAEFARALWWTNCVVFVLVAAVVAFIRSYFRTGRRWLAHLAWVGRLVALVVNFVRTPSFDYDEIVRLRPITLLGAQVNVPEGTTSLWHWFGQVSLGLLLWFVLDASYELWRAGTPHEKRRALVIGVPTAAFVFGGAASAALIFGHVVDLPHLEFVPFVGVLVAMAYELSGDVLRAARLAGELQVSEAALRESERRMHLAADAARLGMWMWDLRSGEIWLTDECRELFGLSPDAPVGYDAFFRRIHPDDQARIDAETRVAREGASEAVLRTEYRVILPDGGMRWIASHLRVDSDGSGSPFRMVGVCIDVSDRRLAELSARELSGRLINAQEDERRRLARDLHDDLNQQLALLSVELELVARSQTDTVRLGIEQIASRVRGLSSQVHRLAYQLHPAKLDQLGLETAARSWCRELAEQSGMRIEFAASDVPADVPADTALCVYRIMQEALRNAVRHGKADAARVELTCADRRIHLVVSDSGCGFDINAARDAAGLGLLSMRERAQLIHGSIVVESQRGKGTRVVTTVPLPDGSAAHSRATADASSKYAGASLR